jgi:sodium transport system permease protein
VRFHFIKNIITTDIKMLTRDTKTMTALILLPLITVPLLLVGIPLLLFNTAKEVALSDVQIAINQKLEPELENSFNDAQIFVTVTPDPRAAIENNQFLLGLVLQGLDPSQTVPLEIIVKNESTPALTRVKTVLAAHSRAVVEQRLRGLKLDPVLLTPFEVKITSVDPPQGVENFLALIVPVLLLTAFRANASVEP